MTNSHNDLNNDVFADAARQVLADQCTPLVVRAIEAGGNAAPETMKNSEEPKSPK